MIILKWWHTWDTAFEQSKLTHIIPVSRISGEDRAVSLRGNTHRLDKAVEKR
jgi:hypothetical protein